METQTQTITIQITVKAPVEKVWEFWTLPQHIMKWNQASDDWHTTHAENDPRPGGKFLSHMAAKDGSFGFDFAGVYDEVKLHELISYSIGDGRKVSTTFSSTPAETKIVSTFEAEKINSIEMQKEGWQAILNSFKKYTESH
jgi:uncharacterized protein YndB with AHSA1/START domain